MIAIDKAKAYLATVTAPGGEYHARHIIKEMINELEAACTWTESVGGYWATDCDTIGCSTHVAAVCERWAAPSTRIDRRPQPARPATE